MDLTFILQLTGLFLTLSVLLYLVFGDNALFRLVTYLFVGVASGYVLIMVVFQVLIPRFTGLLAPGNLVYFVLGLIPFLLGLLLFFKLLPGAAGIGTAPMGILVGIGAAVAVGGAVFGTLFGQIDGTLALVPSLGELATPAVPGAASPLSRLVQGLVTVAGVVSTLAYFQFSMRSRSPVTDQEAAPGARRAGLLETLAKLGQVFIGITLGAVFAGVFSASISALVERLGFIWDVVANLITQFF